MRFAASGPQEVLVFPGGIREIGKFPAESEFTQRLRGHLMNRSQKKILGAIILLLLAVSIYGFWISRDPEAAREGAVHQRNQRTLTPQWWTYRRSK